MQGAEAYFRLPTLLWLWPGDALLLGLCWLGRHRPVGRRRRRPRSESPRSRRSGSATSLLTVAGQDFLSFQWDVLLLEAGLLAVVYAPAGRRIALGTAPEPGAAARWLVWGLAFKLTFLSGITKLLSGDENWWGTDGAPLPLRDAAHPDVGRLVRAPGRRRGSRRPRPP